MQIRLTVRCLKRAGTLARIISTLRRADFNIVNQNSEDLGLELLIKLVVRGSATNTQDFERIIDQIDGVLSVKTDIPPTPRSGYVAKLPGNQGDPANRIALAYPNIGALVGAERKRYPREQASAKQRTLRLRVASIRANAIPQIVRGASLTDIAKDQIVPEILPIARAEIGDSGLKVLSSIFTEPSSRPRKGLRAFGFSMASAIDSDAERCDFLCGYIQGILDLADWLRELKVNEVYCRSEGQPFCLFEFD